MGNFIRLVFAVAIPLAVGGLSGFVTAQGVQDGIPP